MKNKSMIVLMTLLALGCTKKDAAVSDQQAAENLPKVTELKIEDIQVGTGKTAQNGSFVDVHYTGTLTNGKKFDSSVDRGQPFGFMLGANQVIQGWEKGILGMKEGGKRKLTIPSSLGYGPQGMPPVIPQDATLVFDVQLMKVHEPQQQAAPAAVHKEVQKAKPAKKVQKKKHR